MKALFVNTKSLFQSYIMLGLIAIVSFGYVIDVMFAEVAPANIFGKGTLTLYLAPCALLALWVGSVQVDILTKPFSFCLPGHRQVLLFGLVLAGLIVSFCAPLLFIHYYYSSVPTLFDCAITYFTAASLGFAVYSVVLVAFILWPSPFWVLAVFVGVLCSILIPTNKFVADYLFYNRGLLSAGCILLSTLAYLRLNKSDFRRKHIGKGHILITQRVDSKGLERYRKDRLARRFGDKDFFGERFLGHFFLTRMAEAKPLSRAVCIWGALYRYFMHMPVVSKLSMPWLHIFIVLLVLLFLASGYLIGLEAEIASGEQWLHIGSFLSLALFLISGLLGAALLTVGTPLIYEKSQRQPMPALLLISGRRENFASELVKALICTAIGIIIGLSICAASFSLEPLLPAITMKGKAASYVAISLQYWWLPLVLTPSFVATFVIFGRFAAAAELVVLIPLISEMPMALSWFEGLSFLMVIFLIVMSWLLLLQAIEWKCLGCDLELR